MNGRDLLLRAKAVLFRHQVEQELDEELRSHLEFQTRKHLAAGLTVDEAERRARIEFGGVEAAREDCRDARRVNIIEHFVQDLRYAARGLRREPMLAIPALLTLGLCIGANTTMFSLVNSIILRPLPFPQSERLYWLSERMGRDQREAGIGADYYSLREQNQVFMDVAAYDTLTLNWTGGEKPEQLDAAQVTPSLFTVLATEPLMGRYLAHDEQGRKAPSVAVLSYIFWRNRLGGDPQAVGKTVTLDGMAATVIGIMPQGFDYPKGTQIWTPLPMNESSERPRSAMRPMWQVHMLARLKPEISRQQLDTEMDRLTSRIREEYPKEFATTGFLDNMRIAATPLQRRIVGDLQPALMVLTGAVVLVLLIACANVANLLLARAAARRREMAMRMALGSGRTRIIKQVLTESLALALPGGVAGILLAYLAVDGLNSWRPTVLQNYPPLSVDVTTLAFTFGLSILTGIVFGVTPAIAAAGIDIQHALKSAGNTHSAGRSATRLRHLLVVAQLGVSLVLLIGASLLAKSYMMLAKTELGFPPENLLTLRVNLVESRYSRLETGFYDEVLERMKAVPMVREAAVSTDVPLSAELRYSGSGIPFQVAGRIPLPVSQKPAADVTLVSREFFRTLGIPVRRGHIFDSGEPANNIVVNEAFARQIFPGEDPLGKRILHGRDDSSTWTIVGVVGNIRGSHLGADPAPLVYRCTCQGGRVFPGRMAFFVRTSGNPRLAVRAVESQIFGVDRNQPVFDVKTMEERMADSLSSRRFHFLLIGTFAAIALVLAAVGIYGVMSYLVALRTREVGIRLAMGARRRQVFGLVVGESFRLAMIAIVAGLVCAWALTRYLTTMLYGVTPLDISTFAIMPVVLAAIAAAASLLPAWRAMRTDPLTALREE